MVSAFKGAYRLQFYDYLSKAYVVCFVGSLTHTMNFKLRSESATDYTLYTINYTLGSAAWLVQELYTALGERHWLYTINFTL